MGDNPVEVRIFSAALKKNGLKRFSLQVSFFAHKFSEAFRSNVGRVVKTELTNVEGLCELKSLVLKKRNPLQISTLLHFGFDGPPS